MDHQAVARRAEAPDSLPREFAWPEDDVVRSAVRIRALELAEEGGVDPARERARLQTHFAFVIAWLEAREASSLALAADRYEAATAREVRDATGRSNAERVVLIERLREARRQQLATLREYARNGRFPQNPELAGPTRPIFVDEAGTACAVGHLMRVDGFEEAVEAIRVADNHVFVPDVESGPLLAWVSRSGLLLEEAAVIQPAYAPPPGPGNVDLSALAAPGASVEVSGLRIDRFSARRTTLNLPDGFTPELLANLFPFHEPREAIEILTQGLGIEPDVVETSLDPQALSDLRLSVLFGHAGDENSFPLDPYFETSPIASPFLFWNAADIGGFLTAPGMNVDQTTFEIGFDVSPVASGYGIDGSLFGISGAFWLDAPTFGSDLEIEVLISTVGGEVLARYVDQGGSDSGNGAQYFARDDFEAQETVRVVVRGSQTFAAEPLQWTQFRQDFRIVPVPEPSSGLLIGLGLLVLSRRSRA